MKPQTRRRARARQSPPQWRATTAASVAITIAIALVAALSLCGALAVVEAQEDGTVVVGRETLAASSSPSPTTTTTTTTVLPSATHTPTPSPTGSPDEPNADGGGNGDELSVSRTIFFILLVLVLCTLLVYLLIRTKFHYIPESLAVMFIGGILGIITRLSGDYWTNAERIDPTGFFLILLPPIILESGYSLHKGNFFHNIGSILVFAVFGTIFSALCIGAGVFGLGVAGVSYPLSAVESFAFGSLISAVDPVATIAIFNALDVDPTLNMLVFGESVLNDAVSIVLTNTIIQFATEEITVAVTLTALGKFCLVGVGSALIGVLFGLVSALLLKFVALRTKPSLEFAIVVIFAYAPYFLAEFISMSGIMAILFCGIVMAHYTHFNLSPITQMTTQQVFRTTAFLAETSVFAYLGLALFSFADLIFSPSLLVWSIVLCFIGRAANIFPLSALVNRFRSVKITPKFQFIMWFSGLRGAIAFALSIHLPLTVFSHESRSALIATTLVIVLFTIVCLGGTTLPLIKLIGGRRSDHGPRASDSANPRRVVISKTQEMDATVDARDMEGSTTTQAQSFIERLDTKYLTPFFRRTLTLSEIDAAHFELETITGKRYTQVSATDSDLEISRATSPLTAELAPVGEEQEEDNDDDILFDVHGNNGDSDALLNRGRRRGVPAKSTPAFRRGIVRRGPSNNNNNNLSKASDSKGKRRLVVDNDGGAFSGLSERDFTTEREEGSSSALPFEFENDLTTARS